MAITPVDINRGTVPGDNTGDTAYDGAGIINTNFDNIAALANQLQNGQWAVDNTTAALALGEKIIVTDIASTITKTLPASLGILGTSYNAIFIANMDDSILVRVNPQVGEVIYRDDPAVSGGPGGGFGDLRAGMAGIYVPTGSGEWHAMKFWVRELKFGDLEDYQEVSLGTGEILQWNGTKWRNYTPEEADLVERDAPAIETTPYLKHETRADRASGTEEIVCADDPSVRVKITGNNVTINLDTPALSLPERGLDDIALRGIVHVLIDGTPRTGLTVTTDAGSSIGTFPKGTAPTAANEEALLVWYYYDDGTNDYMWAEWTNDS